MTNYPQRDLIEEAIATSYGNSKSSAGSRLAWLTIREEVEFWNSDFGIRICVNEAVEEWKEAGRPGHETEEDEGAGDD